MKSATIARQEYERYVQRLHRIAIDPMPETILCMKCVAKYLVAGRSASTASVVARASDA
jgi:hypothetical protein